jgi:hypothetical protein
MSYAELQEHIWSQLSLRKRLAGRAACDRILRRAVRVLPSGMMSQSNPTEQNRLMKQTAADIVRHERHNNVTMGILLTIILSALVSEIVKLLLAWWRSRSENQVLLRGYQQEMTSNG